MVAFSSYAPLRLIGVEISPRFREELVEKLKGLPIKVEIFGDDAKDMKSFLPDVSVDSILAVNVVYFLDPLEEYAVEMSRVLKVGGKVLLAVKSSAMLGHSDVFRNTDNGKIKAIFQQAGFLISEEKVKFRNPLADYTAIYATKQCKQNAEIS